MRFMVGQRVEVRCKGSQFDGAAGQVVTVNKFDVGALVEVRFSDTEIVTMHECWLERLVCVHPKIEQVHPTLEPLKMYPIDPLESTFKCVACGEGFTLVSTDSIQAHQAREGLMRLIHEWLRENRLPMQIGPGGLPDVLFRFVTSDAARRLVTGDDIAIAHRPQRIDL